MRPGAVTDGPHHGADVSPPLGPAGRGSVAFITVTALITARVAKAGLGQATSVLAAQRPGARGMLLANLLSFSLVTSLTVGGAAVGGLYLLEAEPAGNRPVAARDPDGGHHRRLARGLNRPDNEEVAH